MSNTHKSNSVKSIKRLFKWQAHEKGGMEWDSEITFSTNDSASQPRDFLTLDERKKFRETALNYGSIPSYSSLTAEERDEEKQHLAQRFGKSKSEITEEDWKRTNGWKIPSLVWVSLDAGLRPCEVSRAVCSWVDTENRVLRMPKEESSKNRENWTVALQS